MTRAEIEREMLTGDTSIWHSSEYDVIPVEQAVSVTERLLREQADRIADALDTCGQPDWAATIRARCAPQEEKHG